MQTRALTIGNFDGVHLGHRALVNACRKRARHASAMFFDPHPATFFGRAENALLTAPRRRAKLLAAAGADVVDVRAFDAGFASQSPEAFVRDVIVRDHEAKVVVVGPDFRFGKGASGDVETLRTLGSAHDFEVHVVEAVLFEDAPISSTRVRQCLADGAVDTAYTLLGRHHTIAGTVVKGHQRGRTIGFPTANLASVAEALPKDGVYAVAARVDDRVIPGMANLGTRPTFEAGRSIEVHLFDTDQDLYDRLLPVAFVARIRDERRFEGVDALVKQLAQDADSARAALANSPSVAAFVAYDGEG